MSNALPLFAIKRIIELCRIDTVAANLTIVINT